MKTPVPDDDLRQPLQELGRREAATAPPWDRVLRGRRPIPVPSGVRSWLRPAVALAGVFLVVAVAWWWPTRPQGGRPVVGHTEGSFDGPAEEWDLPTDGLLAGAGEGPERSDVDRLSREIEGLLQP